MRITVESIEPRGTYKVYVEKEDSMYHGDNTAYSEEDLVAMLENIIRYGM